MNFPGISLAEQIAQRPRSLSHIASFLLVDKLLRFVVPTSVILFS
jgi:hypothetical protein